MFELDQLQVEDAANPPSGAKFELEDEGHVLRPAQDCSTTCRAPPTCDTGQVAVFVGPWFAVTVRHGSTATCAACAARVATSPNLRAYGPFGVLYAVLDSAVDGYVAVMDEVIDDIENLEIAGVRRRARPPRCRHG